MKEIDMGLVPAGNAAVKPPVNSAVRPIVIKTEVAAPRESTPARRAWRRLARRRGAMFGLFIVLMFVAVAICASWIAPHDPLAASWSAVRKAPSQAFLFGTDELGRDVLSRVIWGSRASLLVGLLSVCISMMLGVPIGLLAGYLGGWTDGIISRITDAMLAVPFLILAIALAAFLGPNLTNVMIAIGVSATPVFIRLTRAQVLAVKVEDFVEAARAVGNPHWRIALRHVLPNIMAPLIVQSTLAIAAAIIAEASLSFLGLGQQPPAPSWGSMLNVAKNYVDTAPWMAIWPGLSIFLLVVSLNLLGDGLRDAFDPRHK
jgi:peptide/nickel transport system permease protein